MPADQQSSLNRGLKLTAPRTLYFVIFAISGFSGLIYESIWSHYLKLFLGHAAYAQSLVLIIFMGGMALGSWFTSRFSAKSRSPLLLYAGIELVVGVLALLFHDVFTSLIDVFYATVLPSTGSPVGGAVLKWLAARASESAQNRMLPSSGRSDCAATKRPSTKTARHASDSVEGGTLMSDPSAALG